MRKKYIFIVISMLLYERFGSSCLKRTRQNESSVTSLFKEVKNMNVNISEKNVFLDRSQS